MRGSGTRRASAGTWPMRAEADGLRVTIRGDVLYFTNHGHGVAPSWPQVSQCGSPSKPAPLSAAPAHDKAVEEEKDHRADDGADEASALSRVIPPDGLPEVGGNKCANDSQDGGEDKSLRLVVARHDKLGDNAGDEANDDRPDNAHITPSQDGPAQTSLARQFETRPATSGTILRSPRARSG